MLQKIKKRKYTEEKATATAEHLNTTCFCYFYTEDNVLLQMITTGFTNVNV